MNYYPPDEYDHFYCDRYYDDLDADMYDFALQMNRRLKALAEEYRTFIEDCIRVKTVYAAFLEKIHYRNEYLHAEETAEIFKRYLSEQGRNLRPFDMLHPSGTMLQTLIPLEKDGHTIMCEKYRFGTLGEFLYIDLFKGLENQYITRKCVLCGKDTFCLKLRRTQLSVPAQSKATEKRPAETSDTERPTLTK